MSTTTVGLLDAILVSDLPPVREHRAPTSLARIRGLVTRLHQERSFERALRSADSGEQADLIAALRRG